ncbi:hypothetical protein TNCV_36191 [Trichonephila clavipes]|nr:hypothetical protein TNCV_36191 [Trichonephila clavipes]
MKIVDDYIVNEAKRYADDIAIWHSHTVITISKNVLNENLSHIEDWAKQLKLLINPEENKYCVFSTDSRNRAAFCSELRSEGTEFLSPSLVTLAELWNNAIFVEQT